MARRNAFRAPAAPPSGPRTGRLWVVVTALGLAYGAVLARAWYLQIHRHDDFAQRSDGQHHTAIELRARRGDIVDRRGRELAVTAMVPSVTAVPAAVSDPDGTARALARLLDLDPAPIARRLARGNQFAWIARHVTPEQARAVEAAGLEGIHLTEEPRRFYPNRTVAGALLGFAGIDGVGLEGIERDWDRHLRGREYVVEVLRDARGRRLLTGGYLPIEQLSGHRLELTLDARIQQVAESSLAHQVREMDARGGVVIVMEPETGDVLAMAQTPAFDPNLFSQADPGDWRNRAVTDILEPGSTIKPFLVAAALDAGTVRPDTVFDGMKGRIKVGRKVIRDVHAADELTALEVVQKSSNVGAVQIAQRLGREQYHAYLRAFGFGEETGLGLRGEQAGVLRPASRWGQIHLATIAYGYGITATPLQMARAMAAIANGGELMRPRLVRRVVDAAGRVVEEIPPRVVRRVLDPAAARDITRALEMVTQDGGTGRRARVPGYRVAGKTGTAHMVDPLIGGYSRDKIRASFLGFVPAQDPKLVIYVVVDEPLNGRYGGEVAAPVFREIAREVLPYLGIEATEPFDPADFVEPVDEEAVAEGIEPQARPWWFEAPLVAGAPAHIVVPDLRGKALSEVVVEAAALGVELDIAGAGLVVSQRPQAGGLLAPDGRLKVVMALPGEPRRRPPDGLAAGEGAP